ncbi:hypothetical protein CR513_29599, partial [Mucuna pruriens]
MIKARGEIGETSRRPRIHENRYNGCQCKELQREKRYEEEPHKERRYEEDRRRAPLDALKCKIPPFVGDEDTKSYLEWEMKNQCIREVREGRRRHTDTWLDLRRKMRSSFVSASYVRDLYTKLQRMHQGSKSVEEYFEEMEIALMRANALESNEATMA